MRIIYIAGPYTAQTSEDILANVERARSAATALARRSIGFYCPHTMSAGMDATVPDQPMEFWYAMDLAFLPVCSEMLMLQGWERSVGATREHVAAQRAGMPIYYSLDEVPSEAPGAAHPAHELYRHMQTLWHEMDFNTFATNVLNVKPNTNDIWQTEKWHIFQTALSSLMRLSDEHWESIIKFARHAERAGGQFNE